MLKVHLAWPWELGSAIPVGFVALTDDDGNLLTDDEGYIFVVEE